MKWSLVLTLIHLVAELTSVSALSSIHALSDTSNGGDQGSCRCLPWADVYNKRNVTCGQGFELFHGVVGFEGATTKRTAFVENNNWLLTLLRGAMGSEFCQNFFMRNTENYCVYNKFMMEPKEQHYWFADKSWCYVDSTCVDLNGGNAVTSAVSWKSCSPRSGDVALHDMQPEQVVKLAAQQHFDAGLLPGFAYHYVDLDPSKMGRQLVEKFKRSKVTTYIWPKAAHLKPRLIISGAKVFRQTLSLTGWRTACIEGCTPLRTPRI